uniref:Uncharacterized protein n=2 Tax=Anas TaxID=8835 RepID=A0A8B9UYC0_9AVES
MDPQLFKDEPISKSGGILVVTYLRKSKNIVEEEILLDVVSQLWFTSRKNFLSIKGTNPTSDTGFCNHWQYP